ncbi:alpha/beta fold hydrolase [Actinotalea fermentans]|uniref:alpha/beta fold hydrolase n=1 Tax=Actinotalea fermentans TaxID=43671 RepID=UPI0011BE797F|nr:alpha/beta hydrolase [Actinotalea fermentans]
MSRPGTLEPGRTTRGLPSAAFGAGPPLVVLPGLTPRHTTPGAFAVRSLPGGAALGRDHRVHLLQRRPGLAPGTTMADLADDVAAAVRDDLGGGPVPVLGVSTGGSIALQLAVDHADLVSRLVLVCAAARLGDDGRRRQRRLAELTRAGRPRAAWGQLGTPLAGTTLGRAAVSVLCWLGGGPAGDDAADLLATVAAEDAFDVTRRLGEVRAPALVVGGGRDGFYGDLIARTAAGLGARLVLAPRASHMTAAGDRTIRQAVLAFLGPDGA